MSLYDDIQQLKKLTIWRWAEGAQYLRELRAEAIRLYPGATGKAEKFLLQYFPNYSWLDEVSSLVPKDIRNNFLMFNELSVAVQQKTNMRLTFNEEGRWEWEAPTGQMRRVGEFVRKNIDGKDLPIGIRYTERELYEGTTQNDSVPLDILEKVRY